MTFSEAAAMGPPKMQTLEEALTEIERLRYALFQANQKVGDVFEQKELIARSFEDEVNHYKKLLGLK